MVWCIDLMTEFALAGNLVGRELWVCEMDPGQLVLPVAGIVAAAALTFYVVSFSEMSAKSFDDYEAKIDGEGPETQLKSSLSAKKKRQARQVTKPKK